MTDTKRSYFSAMKSAKMLAIILLASWLFTLCHPVVQGDQPHPVTLTFPVLSDGYLDRAQQAAEGNADPNVAYANVWNAISGDVKNIYSNNHAAQICSIQGGWLAFEFDRIALTFDTSTVGSQGVSSATLSICTEGKVSDVGPLYNLTLQAGQAGYPHVPISSIDYCRGFYYGNFGSTNSTNLTAYQYTNITINNLSLIQTGGVTGMVLRLSVDVDGNHTGWNAGQSIDYSMYSSRSAYPAVLYVTTGTAIQSSITTYTETTNSATLITTTSTVLSTTSVTVATSASSTSTLSTTKPVTVKFFTTSLNLTTTTVFVETTTSTTSVFVQGSTLNTSATSVSTATTHSSVPEIAYPQIMLFIAICCAGVLAAIAVYTTVVKNRNRTPHTDAHKMTL